jgi:type I restriction enzyme R subunit
VLTDRIDLDTQISGTFVACGLPNPTQASSVAALREAVAMGGNGQILLSTIFKFQGSKTAIPNSDNWIVLVDECHRSQEKDLGAYLQATLPDARFFGFTGTPIKSDDKDTYKQFSVEGEGYLDKYGIDDAVRDGATVPILYEGRKTDSTSCSTAGSSICPTTSSRTSRARGSPSRPWPSTRSGSD